MAEEEADEQSQFDEALERRLSEPLLTGAAGGRAELISQIAAVIGVLAAWVAVAILGTWLGTGWFWIPAVTVANVLTLWVGAGVFITLRNVRYAQMLRPIYKQVIRHRRERRKAEEKKGPSA